MKVIVDDKIPYIHPSIGQLADQVCYLPGKEITPDAVKDADALIIRTRTRCNEQLLAGSKVRFIATATIGYDHIDTAYCRQHGITWANAPGCNASSVAQYIESCLILLETDYNFPLKGKTIGIVGVGNVGSKIKDLAGNYGLQVLLNDPPRAAAEGNDAYVSLQTILEESDIITFHVPLSKEGSYKTWHMGNNRLFESLKRTPVIINTSRGEVLDTSSLIAALNTGKVSKAIIDVWENEPDINLELLNKTIIATPHIAGYSADGKATATRMSLEAFCRYFNIPASIDIALPPVETTRNADTMEEALLNLYDPRIDSEKLKAQPELFEWFRGNYPLRREKKG